MRYKKTKWAGSWLVATGKVMGRHYDLRVALAHQVIGWSPTGVVSVCVPMHEVLPPQALMMQTFCQHVQAVIVIVREALATPMHTAEVMNLFETQCDQFFHTGRLLIVSGTVPRLAT